MALDGFAGMERRVCPGEGGAVVYWVHNCSAEVTLALLHGLTANHTLFERQITHFAGRCNLLCWDAPAHGESRPYDGFSYARAARDLRRILEREGLRRVVMVGQSMGGYIAQSYMKLYPEGCIGFVGIDTCPFGTAYYSKSDLWWLRQVEWMSLCFPRGLLMRSIAHNCSCTKDGRRNMYAALQLYSRRELCHLMGVGYAGFLEANCDLDLPCPTRILLGAHDRTGKVRTYCRAWHARTGVPLRVIPDAAHNSNYDNSAAVNREIDAFLQEILQKDALD